MKKIFIIFALCITAFPLLAQESRFKLSLWDEMAWATPNTTRDIAGLDLGIGSTSDYVKGLQLDLAWGETRYELHGLGFSWGVNKANEVSGAQISSVNMAENINGVQFGAINLSTGAMQGLQVGFFNNAEDLRGFQVGIVNHARNIYGVQFGLINIAENGFLPVMIFVNGRFDSSFNI